ncbi:hypothetical protein MNBD_GAMMA12-422 [hydrothermal vent metagenome]|uniref:Uncharacterized protein n=1 Tax=hydrothermal vent metagenome TaxID=652676 RepID=A0A3B0YII1_9ZZZZ
MNNFLLKISLFSLLLVSSVIISILILSNKKSRIYDPMRQPLSVSLTIKLPGKLAKLIPSKLVTNYHRWANFDPVTPQLINQLYSRYAFHVASSKPVARLIRSAIARNLYPSIPKQAIFRYLKDGKFNANGIVSQSTLPYLNFSLFGYHSRRPFQNSRVLYIAKILIAKGANVNAVDINSGRSPLHEAVLMNHPEVVKFLLKNKADPHLKVSQAKSKFHGMDALQFAIFMQEAARGENYNTIIKILNGHLLRK